MWVGALAALCVPALAGEDEPKSADEIIAKYVEAIGGRKKLDSVNTMKSSGKLVMGGGIEAPLVIENKRPDKVRFEFTFQGMTGTQAFDGTVGWFVMPFMGKPDPEKMSDDQLKAMREQAEFDPNPLIDYAKKGHKAELIGKDDVDGTDAYKIKLTREDGSVEYHYFDAEYFIPLKVEGKREFQGTEIEYSVTFGDYKEVDGMMIAHKVMPQGGMGGTLTFEDVELNVPIDEARFRMPEVKRDDAEKKADEGEKEGKKEADDESDS
jgi:outer membrane lipoprotein-sorting protein